MTKNLNTRISEELDDKIKVLRNKHCINISKFIQQCIETKYDELENANRIQNRTRSK